MQTTRFQELIIGLRSSISARLRQKRLSLARTAELASLPKHDLREFLKCPLGDIKINHTFIQKLRQIDGRKGNFWDAHTKRLFRAVRDFEKFYR